MKGIMQKLVSLAAVLAVIGGSAVLPAAAEQSGGAAAKSAAETYKTTAFRGAEGGGMYASGARGAVAEGKKIEVYHVTNLDDGGEGSFRDAVSKGNRIVVFDVSGYIDLSSNITIGHPNMTILGQTAPGDGICFRGDNIKIGTDNVIMRYLRFRVGAAHADGTVTPARDGLEITDACENIILDHCSVSWGTDENLSAYAVKNVTIQNCIIAEALNQSVHDKGEHSYAAIWGGVNLTVHHNIIATHKSRNPKIGTSETVAMTPGYTDAETLVDIRNNIIYNWGDKAGYGAENGANVNVINNYYKPGPATPESKRARIFELSPGNKYQPNWSGAVYASGNYVDDPGADAQAVNEENWQIEKRTGVYLDLKNPLYERLENANETYINDYPITTSDARTAYSEIIENAGARLPKLDAVDQRIIDNVINGEAPTGSKGSVGLVDDPTDGAGAYESDERGYPVWTSERRGADYDTDLDGIPDAWETEMGLNPENPTDSTLLGAEGRTFLEMYVEAASGGAERNITVQCDDSGDVYVTGRSGDTVSIYVDGEHRGDVTLEKADGYPIGCTLITAVYADNGTLISAAADKYMGAEPVYPSVEVPENCTVKHFAWNSLAKMQPVPEGSAGAAALNISDKGLHTVTAVSKADGAYSNNAYIVRQSDIFAVNQTEGDFTLILTLNDIPTVTKNACGIIKMTSGSDAPVIIGAGCNDKYEKTIVYSGGEMPMENTKYLKAERLGDKISLYKSSSLLGWELIAEFDVGGQSTAVMGEYIVPDGEMYAADISARLITETTEPQISIENVTENQRLGFNENIEVKVMPDDAAVQLVSIALNGKELVSLDTDIAEERIISVPVAFAGIDAGALTVSCVDSNLCTASDSVNVTVSADTDPWQIADIGTADTEVKTYVSMAQYYDGQSDYTYKINAPEGYIGGTADKCGYLYQRFTGDNRIYYRSRMQGSSQFGIMFRSSLEADAVTYWFGGEYNADGDGKLKYNFKRRADGGEMTVEYTLDNQQANLYFIAEKAGGKINIYQTENGSTVYKTKTLLTSIDAQELGDEYYMGFAAAGGSGNPADAGWMAIEGIDGNTVKSDFDYGLSRKWQVQELNILAPSWTRETIGGNDTGKMLIETKDGYASERYVYCEYLTGEGNQVITASADIMLTGDEAAFNMYVNAGTPDKGFKISFADDGLMYVGNTATEYAFETNKWYTVEIVCDMGVDPEAARVVVADSDGRECISVEAAAAVAMRAQKDTKKQEIRNGVFLEPVKGISARYYIDNVNVDVTESSIQKVVLASHMWNFGTGEEFSGLASLVSGTEYAGLNVIGGGTVESGRNKTIDGILFPSRYKIGGPGSASSKCVWFDIPAGTTDIVVYGEPAGSSGERSVVINIGGTEAAKTVLTTQMSVPCTHTGEAARVYIYGDAGINLYGVSYETYTYTE